MLTFLFALLLASAAPKKQQASNPCADPPSQLQMNRCAAAEYRKVDAELNALYDRLIKNFEKDVNDAHRENDANQIKYSETGLNELKEAERAWILYRDLHCKAAEQRFEGGTIRPLIWSGCMRQVTEHRIDELKGAYENQ
jgi:uncharacterized protein YecT (DUF1311 family)